MAKFNVLFEQWVQEITKVEIEADTAEDALRIAREREDSDDFDLDWSDGSDVDYRGVVEVQDLAGKPLILESEIASEEVVAT